ncbi:NYN domain-containing protein [Halomonas halocynthiae]|uniref:LabA-like NYN domain-containing protein n=1 Tax=Halomonas halocynthiae TaxID=176290 RepID=UPI0004054F36|nr:NYN domain-containing protein [Halomonas halocynthiae]
MPDINESATASPTKNVVLLIDVQNLYYTARQTYGKHVNYNTLWAMATQGRHVDKAFAYAIDRGDTRQRQFQNILRGIGFEMRLKPFIQRADGSAKGDWDVGITLDAMRYGSSADIVVLASGDGDFAMLADALREEHNVEVEVYGVAALTAAALMRSATRFIPIEGKLLMR